MHPGGGRDGVAGAARHCRCVAATWPPWAGRRRAPGLTGPPVIDWEKEKIENVFSPYLKIAYLTNLDSDFGKTPIGGNVLLIEFYNFVKRANSRI